MIQIDFQHTGISPLIKDYLSQKEELKPFFNLFPTKQNYYVQAKEKLEQYAHRKTLTQVLSQQMQSLNLSDKQRNHLALLKQKNTVTVTTGHQLNLLSGPLYFIYKILHTIKICDTLNKEQDEINYVPIYWMATEDHDFAEINHFNTYQQTYAFDAEAGGYVGNIPSNNTSKTFNSFFENFPKNDFAEKLKSIIHSAYKQGYDLAEATRTLVHQLLGEYGILILDGNAAALKKCMVPIFEKELMENPTQNLVEQTNHELEEYKNQAFARKINLFYLNNNQRERIEKTKDGFILVESGKTFTKEEILKALRSHPEKFSPNVIMRPLYQEVILPNIAYVGGGGELAYWLQLKSVFEYNHIIFPMLVLRNSMVLVPNAYKHKAEKYHLLSPKMFEPKHRLKNNCTEKQSNLFDELEILRKNLDRQFIDLEKIAAQTTASFAQMVNAQKKKQLNGYEKMYQRLLKSERARLHQEMEKIDDIYSFLFPNNTWQERVINFSHFYLSNGDHLFKNIYEHISPFDSVFNILCLDSIAKK